MTNVQLQNLPRVGALTRLAALDTEREALLKMFPDLRSAQQPAAGQNRSTRPATRRRGGMSSPAARKAHGQRMRAYWAAKRAEKTLLADGSTPATVTSPSRKRQINSRKK